MLSRKSAFAYFLALFSIIFFQEVQPIHAVPEEAVRPETGYISDSRYVNAFFGFSLPLPHAEFSDFVFPTTGKFHFLLGLKQERKNLTTFIISATPISGDAAEEVRKAAAGPDKRQIKQAEIGGKEFWIAASMEKSPVGKQHAFTFATSMAGYTLQFVLLSFDAKLAGELRRSIESISFFDPAEAKVLAGDNARLFPVRREEMPVIPASSAQIAQLDPGVASGNTYTNRALGFSFQFPEGWVLSDKETQQKVMEAGHQAAYGNDPMAAREHETFQQCSRNLLWATQHPAGSRMEQLNPLIVIMAFDSGCLPGVHLPKSISDTESLRRLGTQFMTVLSGTPFLGNGQNSINAFMLQNRLMISLSSAFKVTAQKKQPLNVFTSIILTEENDYWVAWMFMNGSQAGLEDLKKSIRIIFASPISATEQIKPI